MTPEQRASQLVRKRFNEWGGRLFRNNTGVLPDKTGRPVRFGVGNESKEMNRHLKFGDYIGWLPVTITPDMVGQTLAVFADIEVKPDGEFAKLDAKINSKNLTREKAQNNAVVLVVENGGLGGFAANENHVDYLVQNFLGRIKNGK